MSTLPSGGDARPTEGSLEPKFTMRKIVRSLSVTIAASLD